MKDIIIRKDANREGRTNFGGIVGTIISTAWNR